MTFKSDEDEPDRVDRTERSLCVIDAPAFQVVMVWDLVQHLTQPLPLDLIQHVTKDLHQAGELEEREQIESHKIVCASNQAKMNYIHDYELLAGLPRHCPGLYNVKTLQCCVYAPSTPHPSPPPVHPQNF